MRSLFRVAFSRLISSLMKHAFPHGRRALRRIRSHVALQPEAVEMRMLLTAYFVDAEHGSDANPGTSLDLPWKTYLPFVSYYSAADRPANAVTLEPGDVVSFLNGRYDATYQYGEGSTRQDKALFLRNVHGTADEPITLKAYPGHTPVFSARSIGREMDAIHLLQSSYIVLDGLEVANTYGGGIRIDDGHHFEVARVHVHDVDGVDNNNLSGLVIGGVFDIRVHDSRFHDNYDRTNADTGGRKTYNSCNVVLFGGGGVVDFHDNEFWQTPSITADKTGGGIKYKHAAIDSNATFRVVNNVFRNCAMFSVQSGTSGSLVANNLIIDSGPIEFRDCGGFTRLQNNVVEHNTLINRVPVTGENGSELGGGLSYSPTTEWAPLGSLTFRNNIVVDTRTYNIDRGIVAIEPYGSDVLYDESIGKMTFTGNRYFNAAVTPQFNLFNANGGSRGVKGSTYSLAGWQALGFDVGSLVIDPRLDSNFVPQDASSADAGWRPNRIAPTPNRAPVGVDDSVVATQGVPLNVAADTGVLANDTDADGNRLTARLTVAPQHGTLVLQADGSFRYTPDADFFGADQFTYVANDGQVDSVATTVELIVNQVVPPTPPTAVIDSVTPDPRTTPVGVVTINFSEAVTGVDASDFRLARNGAPVTLSGLSVTRVTATQYTLDLTPFTSSVGNYELTLRASGSGVVDLEGTPLAANASEIWATTRDFYFSTSSGGSLISSSGSKVSFKDADILRLVINADGTFQYTLAFDGSDVGLTTSSEDVDAFVVLPDGRLVVSTVGAFSVPSTGGVTLTGRGEDLLLFTPTSLGDTTAGAWSLYFDGSDVGLSGSNETVDSVAVLVDGRILISTAGAVSVPGVKGDDEDLLAFTPTSLGSNTAGQWTLYFDGSDVGLTQSSEDVVALFVEGSATMPTLHLATTGNFSVAGSAGANEDIFTFRPTSLGATTTGTFASGLTLDGSLYRLASFALDGIALGSQLSQQPEITVTDVSSATNMVDGQTAAIDFGSLEEDSTAPIKTFRIRNDGTALLSLGQIQLPTGFLQVAPLASTTLRPGDAVELQVRFDTTVAGMKSGQVIIHNNDADESLFNFAIQGTVTVATDPPDPDTDVFFSSDFERLDSEEFNQRDQNGWNLPGVEFVDGRLVNIGRDDNILLVSTPLAHSGSQALRVTYTADEDYGGAEVKIPDGGSSFVRTRQFMRFGADYDFGRGQKIHRIRSFNQATDRNDWDIVVLVWGKSLPGHDERDLSGQNDMHILSANFNGGPNEWGAVWIDNFGFERERWYEITTEVQLNTIGQSDGFVRIFVDGQLKGERTGLMIRSAEAPGDINTVMFGGWYSNGGLPPATPTSLLIDDVSISTTPGNNNPTPPPVAGTVLVDENFEDGSVGFGYVPPVSGQTQIVTGESYGTGNRAYQITYATDEFEAKLEKYNVQGNTLEVSFASKLPEGIPIETAGRGSASLTLSRLARESGDPPGRGLQQWLTYYRAGSEGPNSLARYEMNYNVQFSDRVFRVPVTILTSAWLHTRYFIQFNTPGQNDGIFLVWHNGQLVVNARDVAFADTSESRPNSALIGGHFSHGGTNPDRPFRRLVDDVHIAVNGDLPTT